MSLSSVIERFTHRHFVVMPMFIVLALTPVWMQYKITPPVATLLVQQWEAAEEEQFIFISPGRSFVLFPGGSIRLIGNTLQVERGSVLVYSLDPLHVQLDTKEITLWSGAAHLTNGAEVIVAPISAPVLVEEDENSLLVPNGLQWRTQPNRKLSGLEDGVGPWLATRRFHVLPLPFHSTMLRRVLNMTSGNSLIAENATADDPSSIFAVAPHPRILLPMLPQLFATPATWTVSSIHPHAWGMSWVHPAPEHATKQQKLARIVSFPHADITPIGAPGLARQRWQDAVFEFADAALLPDAFASEIYIELEGIAEEASARGYPERAAFYRETQQRLRSHYRFSIAAPKPEPIPPNTTILGTVVEPQEEEPDTTENPPIDDEPAETTPAQSIDVVQSFLEGAGGVMAADTSFRAEEDYVLVENIEFADKPYSFKFNPATFEVSEITFQGQRLPNALPFDDFADWVMKQ